MELFTYHVYCCRHWPVSRWFRVGRCGICGQKPKERELNPDCKCTYCEKIEEELGGEG